MARILMVASEAAPFCKTGGLADVLGALPQALAFEGQDVAVVLPLYRAVKLEGAKRVWDSMPLWVGPGRYEAAIWEVERKGVRYFFVDIPAFFDREGLYGTSGGDHFDNYSRFAGLCHAALGIARHIFRPNIIHCHDWQTGLLPVYLRQFYASDPTFHGIRTVFTIHNLGYQGRYSKDKLFWIGLPESLYRMDLLEFDGGINLLKAGIVFSDYLTTVSPAYAEEIQSPQQGFGLDGMLSARGGYLQGILNGVDYHEWDPAHDPHIAAPYTADDPAGKADCKLDLLREFGLPLENPETPVVGIVSRLAAQKGFDLIASVAYDLVNWDIRMVVLGTGDRAYEDLFRTLAHARPEKFAVRIAYDNRLAHKIEAGSDLFLMPSHYEPCGLNQMYSLRYGAVPVVHATGGLDDTIDSSTGFKFRPYSGEAMLGALREALTVYWTDKHRWDSLVRTGMRRDYSWEASAARYIALYEHLLHG